MKITKVEVYPVTVSNSSLQTHRNAAGGKVVQETTIIKIYTDEGLIGLGEAVSRAKYGGTQDINTVVLSKYFGPALIGQNPLDIQQLIHKIGGSKFSGADSPWLSALHAVDIALYDILGKATGLPLYQLLGGRVREKIGLSRNLPLRSPEESAELAVGFKETGYKLLTVKMGTDPDEDVRRVMAVKKAVGEQFPVDADAGEGYTADVAISTLKRLEGVLCGIEQPVAWWDLFGMARVCKALDMPVVADQSARTPRHVSLVVKLEAADQISLKLPEQGGITLASEGLAIAKAANIPVCMGSLNPLGIGTAALHHWTTAKEWVRPPIGYGSPLERLGDDIVTEPAQVKNGEVSVSDKPGLGVELDEKKMRQYAVKITVNHN